MEFMINNGSRRNARSWISPHLFSPVSFLFSLLLVLCSISPLLSQRLQNDGYSCRANRPSFPDVSFASQNNRDTVYLRVDAVAPGTLTEVGLSKFATVFGVRVVGDDGVSDAKILYLATLLAELLDIREKGEPANFNLVKSLRRSHSMIVLVSDRKRLKMLSIRQYRPKELKCFSRAFHVAHEAVVKTDGSLEEVCPQDEGKKDRSRGLVGDFLVSKGYPATYPADAEIGIRMKEFFLKAKQKRWVNTGASNCQSSVCAEIAFQSWALSSALGSDKCWCLASKEWKFCTPKSMKRGFPELWGTLSQELVVNGVMQPDGVYNSNAVVRA
eukprot:GHVS01107760.1.p1 GENE.GHVS01107760.1~~GHVS01107760.1.p1  ORF type:complete len:328 (+),score=25.51 GHVS01107760.1:367-1350(+)